MRFLVHLLIAAVQLAVAIGASPLDNGLRQIAESHGRVNRRQASCADSFPVTAPVFDVSMLQPGNVLQTGGYDAPRRMTVQCQP
jgi:hypothetical protein